MHDVSSGFDCLLQSDRVAFTATISIDLVCSFSFGLRCNVPFVVVVVVFMVVVVAKRNQTKRNVAPSFHQFSLAVVIAAAAAAAVVASLVAE